LSRITPFEEDLLAAPWIKTKTIPPLPPCPPRFKGVAFPITAITCDDGDHGDFFLQSGNLPLNNSSARDFRKAPSASSFPPCCEGVVFPMTAITAISSLNPAICR
jgi:hypothetical protein